MKVLAKLVVFVIIIILMISSIPMSLGEGETTEGLAKWTFMVYLDSDNNLESAGIEDINEMETVGSTDEVNIVVQMDRCAVEGYDDSNGDWTGAKRFYVTKDEDTNTIGSDEIEDLDEVNMGDPETLVQFAQWTIDNYPAEKYALVLWNHGGAFWGVCWDEDNDEDSLTMPELKYALFNIEEYLGRDLDLVGFDACLMAQVAVMYQIRNSVDIGVGSGYVEPGEGWPYEKILPYLVSDPDMSPEELGIVIADEYVASYTDREEDPDDTTAVTQGVFDLEKFDELANKIDILSMILATKAGTAPQGHHMQILAAREFTNSYDFGSQYFPTNVAPVDPTGYCMYDLIDLMDNLKKDILFDSELRDAASAVKTAAEETILHFAVNPYHGNVKGANGLTIYFPSGLDTTYSEVYNEVDFAVDTYWDEFLSCYHNIENAQNTPPGVFISSPSDDDLIDRSQEGEISVQGTAFDAQNGISSIEINIDGGEWITVGASGQWYHDLSLSELENGNHTICARAFDGNEYSAEASVRFFVAGEEPKSEKPLSPIMPIFVIVLVVAALAAIYMVRKRKQKST
jgi:clostripain